MIYVLKDKSIDKDLIKKLDENPQVLFIDDLSTLRGSLEKPRILVTYKGSIEFDIELDVLVFVGNHNAGECHRNPELLVQHIPSLNIGCVNNLLKIQEFFAYLNSKSEIFESRQQKTLAVLRPVLNSLKFERDRTKKIYTQLRELKAQNYLNLTLNHYHKVGLSVGAEYLRSVGIPAGVDIVGISTESYHLASLWMTFWETSKSLEEKTGVQVLDELFDFGIRGELFGQCLLNYNASQLKISGYLFGHYYFLSSKKENILFPHDYPCDSAFYEKAFFDLEVERGERVLLLSPGIFKNMSRAREERLVQFCLDGLCSDNWKELPDKVIMQLSSNEEYDILDHDISLTLMEVSHHALIDVS